MPTPFSSDRGFLLYRQRLPLYHTLRITKDRDKLFIGTVDDARNGLTRFVNDLERALKRFFI